MERQGMALFEFELQPVETIIPWDSEDGPHLSWFALTYGLFSMNVGDQTLFEYTDAIQRRWNCGSARADYQVAAFARDLVGCAGAAIAPLPARFENLARRWPDLDRAQRVSASSTQGDAEADLQWSAWRWLAERTPDTGYLVGAPEVHFVRVDNQVRILWDNRAKMSDGIPIWTAEIGMYELPVESYVQECASFIDGLLSNMSRRIDSIESGLAKAQAAVDPEKLREQQDAWEKELRSYLEEREPEIPWSEAERAMETHARAIGLKL